MKVRLCALVCCLMFMASSSGRPLTESPRIQAMYQSSLSYRAQSGLHAQHLDEELCKQAQRWANNMAARGMMYHGGGEQVVGQGYASPEACVQGWINSPAHRAWVLGGASRCGFGCQRGVDGRWYYAGVFR